MVLLMLGSCCSFGFFGVWVWIVILLLICVLNCGCWSMDNVCSIVGVMCWFLKCYWLWLIVCLFRLWQVVLLLVVVWLLGWLWGSWWILWFLMGMMLIWLIVVLGNCFWYWCFVSMMVSLFRMFMWVGVRLWLLGSIFCRMMCVVFIVV